MPELSQVKSQLKADSGNIFLRILIALNVANASQVAQKLGIAKQSVYDWKVNVPSVESLVLIAKSGNTSLHWLLTGEGEQFVNQSNQVSFDDLLEKKMRDVFKDEIENGTELTQKILNLMIAFNSNVEKIEIGVGKTQDLALEGEIKRAG